METIRVPDALQSCDRESLKEYLTSGIIHFTSQSAFINALGLPAATVQRATLQCIADNRLGVHGSSYHGQKETAEQQTRRGPQQGPLPAAAVAPVCKDFILMFCHDCLCVACSEPHCNLCVNAQFRRCVRNFNNKYLVGDPLKAGCGAPIRVEAVDKATGLPVPEQDLKHVRLNAVLLSAKTVYAAQQRCPGVGGPSGTSSALRALSSSSPESVPSLPEDVLTSAMVAMHLGKPLLENATFQTGGVACQHDTEGKVVLPFVGSQANISNLVVTGSSESILQSQRPQFLMLIRVIDATTGSTFPTVPPLLSEGFLVATPRVRAAIKKCIPHKNDHVSKLNAVGKRTQIKLRDLHRAAFEAGYPSSLNLPLPAVHTVGQFLELAMWAGDDQNRIQALKKLLKLTKGWEEAVAHAESAVDDDSMLRAWFGQGPGAAALVYSTAAGVPSLQDGPVGILEPVNSHNATAALYPLKSAVLAAREKGESAIEGGVSRSAHMMKKNVDAEKMSSLLIGGDLPITKEEKNSNDASNSKESASLQKTSPPAFSTSAAALAAAAACSSEMRAQADEHWYEYLHPGWTRLPVSTEYFNQHVLLHPNTPLLLSSAAVQLVSPPQVAAEFEEATPGLGPLPQYQPNNLVGGGASIGPGLGGSFEDLARRDSHHSLSFDQIARRPSSQAPTPRLLHPTTDTLVGGSSSQIPILSGKIIPADDGGSSSPPLLQGPSSPPAEFQLQLQLQSPPPPLPQSQELSAFTRPDGPVPLLPEEISLTPLGHHLTGAESDLAALLRDGFPEGDLGGGPSGGPSGGPGAFGLGSGGGSLDFHVLPSTTQGASPNLLARMLSNLSGASGMMQGGEKDSASGAEVVEGEAGAGVGSQPASEILEALVAGMHEGGAAPGLLHGTTPSPLLQRFDSLFGPLGSGGSGLMPTLSGLSLLRGLTPDWSKLSSLSHSEWQQLLQLADSPFQGGSGAWDLAVRASGAGSEDAAAVSPGVAELNRPAIQNKQEQAQQEPPPPQQARYFSGKRDRESGGVDAAAEMGAEAEHDDREDPRRRCA